MVRLLAGFALMAIGGSAMYGSIIVLEPVALDFGTGRAGGSTPYTLFMIGFGVGGVAMGRLSDRVGILVPALIGSVGLSLGFFIAASTTALWQFSLVLGLFSGALGASFTFAPLVSDISHWFSARRGLALGIVISGTYVAGAIWPPVLQRMLDADGWRATFEWLGWVTLLTMLPLSALLYRRAPIDPGAAGGATEDTGRALGFSRNALQCLLCVAGIGCCVAMAMPQVHIVPYVTDLGLPAARGAEMLALMLGFGVVSRLASGWISDRIGGVRTLVLGSALQGLVLVAFLFADGLTSLYAVSIAFGLAQGGIVPAYAMIIRTYLPAADAGWRIATTLLFTISGMAFGGWIAGALFDLTGSYTASFVNAIAFNCLNLLLAGRLLLAMRRTPRGGCVALATR